MRWGSPWVNGTHNVKWYLFHAAEDGSAIPQYEEISRYDPRERPWYKEAKAFEGPVWSSIYLNYGTGEYPVITLAYPIFDAKINGVDEPVVSFAGVIGADVFLEDISEFLKEAYHDSDRHVFILDSESNMLMGTSLNANTYSIKEDGKPGLMSATESEHFIISGATKLLIKRGWPEELIIFDNYYLQSTIYVDKFAGFSVRIVVLLPAVLEPDHLGKDSPLFSFVIAASSLALIVSLVCLLLALYFNRSTLMKLTQPVFSITTILGSIVMTVSAIMLLGENTHYRCTVRVFLFNLAFTFAFVPLLIKSMRVHYYFNLFPNSKKTEMRTRDLLKYMICFLAADTIILCLTLYIQDDGTKPYTEYILTKNGAYADLTYCGYHNNIVLIYTEVVYKGILIIAACYLSFRNRNVVGEIGGSKAVFAIVYNIAIISIVMVTIAISVSDVRYIILVEAVGTCFGVVVTCLLLVVPVVWQIWFIGDKAAAKYVVSKVLASSYKEGNNVRPVDFSKKRQRMKVKNKPKEIIHEKAPEIKPENEMKEVRVKQEEQKTSTTADGIERQLLAAVMGQAVDRTPVASPKIVSLNMKGVD